MPKAMIQGRIAVPKHQKLRDRMERVKGRFPDEIDRTFILKDDASGFPVDSTSYK